MREIKFKAWIKDMKEMVMVHAIQFERNSPKLLPHIVDERNDEHLLNEVILMQFKCVSGTSRAEQKNRM